MIVLVHRPLSFTLLESYVMLWVSLGAVNSDVKLLDYHQIAILVDSRIDG
jgi:hypothetical protein